MALSLAFREVFGRFLESPSRETFRELLEHHTGEYDFLDFKEEWEGKDKLAKNILAFANSGAGCVVIGVSEREDDSTLEITGLSKLTDKTDIKNKVKKFIPPEIKFEIHDFKYEDSDFKDLVGKSFQILMVAHNPMLIPVLSLADGEDIQRNRIYVRKQNSSTEADHAAVKEIISKRIQSEVPELQHKARNMNFREHLSHLNELCRAEAHPLTRLTPSYHTALINLMQMKLNVLEKVIKD